jgi:type IV pilus assembly protein PilA
MRKQKGFSLIELLIVVAIILIIAAIAIPNLLRAKIAANESSAAASIRTIDTAELTFQNNYNDVGYAASLAALGPADSGCTAGPASTNACIIDFTLASAGTTPKSGYLFTAAPTAASGSSTNIQFTADAQPGSVGTTGNKEFCSVEDNVVRYVNPSAGAGATHSGCLGLTAIGN